LKTYNKKIHTLIFNLALLFTSSLCSAEVSILKIAGWDVYEDPESPGKTIGYKNFEKKHSVDIQFTPLSNLDDIVSAAESENDYDIFIISNEGIQLLYGMGLVIPLNLEKLPNYHGLHHNLKYSEWSQFESRVYAVPWAWGPTGLIFDTDIISDASSWNMLWNPAYKGKVAMWDDVSMIWTTALSLGYKNVYSLTRRQLAEVEKKLLKFNAMGANYYAGGGDEVALAKKGKIIAFNSWYDPSSKLKAFGKNFSMHIPKEGAVGMFDSYMISNKKGINTDLTHLYINHQVSPAVQQKMVRATGLAPANIGTLRLLNRDEISALHLDEPDYFNRMILWNHMPRKNLYQKVLDNVRRDAKKQLSN